MIQKISSFCGYLLLVANTLLGQQSILQRPIVDERIELLSIAFRLADCQEYSENLYPDYVARIENHFGKYKSHPLIAYIQKKVRPYGVGFDAVMYMAVSITALPNSSPIQPFSKALPEPRWGKKRATKFLELLNEFYQDTDAAAFFKENRALYQTATTAFEHIYQELDLDWYPQFYGAQPKGIFKIVLGLGNGRGNYGPKIKVNEVETIYAIIGTWKVDSLGHPSYDAARYFPLLLHEFNHSFVNHVVEKYHQALKYSGEKLFKPLEDKMRLQAYGTWQVMYAEAIVRAAVVKYLIDHDYDKELIAQRIREEEERGFWWTGELVTELERYDKNRNKYPTLDSFMPELIKFFNKKANL